MKNKLIITIFSLVVLLMSCTTAEYETPGDLSDVGFYTSEGNTSALINYNGVDSYMFQKGIGDYLSFADLSQGAVNHAWTIQEGNFFLKGPILRTQTEFDDQIINPGDTVSNDDIVHVLFKKSGFQKVRLYNEFKDSVTFKGIRGGVEYDMASAKVGNRWVIDTTFVVKVYDTIVPEIQVSQGDVVVDHTSTDTIYVEAGDVLTMTDLTVIGEPTNRNFFVRTIDYDAEDPGRQVIANGGNEKSDLILKKLGVFEGGVNLSRAGENIPGDFDLYVFPAPIKVIPSSKPFELTGNIRELENETIQIPYNGEFVDFSNKKDFFVVKVNDVVFDIETVAVDEADATFINIKLVDPIYQDDEIKVTFLTGSGLMSTDTREPVLFEDEVVTPFVERYLVAEGQFENSLGTDWVKLDPNETIAAISEVLIVDPPAGTASAVVPTGKVINLAFNRNGGTTANNVRAETSTAEVNLTTGNNYVIKFKYYAEAGSPNILFRFTNRGGANQLSFPPGADRGVWKEGELKFTAKVAHEGVFGILSAWSSFANFYIDDIVILSDESRP